MMLISYTETIHRSVDNHDDERVAATYIRGPGGVMYRLSTIFRVISNADE